eukprot:403351694
MQKSNTTNNNSKQSITDALMAHVKEVDYQKVLATKKQFTDVDFPATLASLSNKDSKLPANQLAEWKNLQWVRAKDLFSSDNFTVFDKDISPNDILQGDLGNCYFLSALSAIAEFPKRIRDIFETEEANPQVGIYAVKVCINGEFRIVVVDDLFPCVEGEGFGSGKIPAFSKTKSKELWVLLIEKVWAKLNHNYENTITGFASEAFRCLTGAPVEFYNHDYVDNIWDQIVEADKRNYIICTSAGRTNLNSDDYAKIGLVSDHAYAVIQAVDIEIKEYGRLQLLKLRNPWGHKEWMGDWSDKSDKWNDDLRKQLNFVDADDGVFFISYRDYMNYYRSTTICKVHDGFKHNSLRVNSNSDQNQIQQGKPRPYQLVKVTLKQKSKIFLTVVQPTKRFVTQNLPNSDSYDTSFVKIIIGKHDPQNFKEPFRYIDAKCSNYDNVSIESTDEYEAGEYVVLVEVDWRQNLIQEYVVQTYSNSGDVQLTLLQTNEHENYLEEVLKSCARQKTQKKIFDDKGENDAYRAISIVDSGAEYGYIYYQNDSKTEGTIVETVVFNKLENFEILAPFDQGSNGNKNHVQVNVGPGENTIIVLRRTDRQASYSVSYFSSILYPDNHYLDQIQQKGKKQQIKYQGEQKDIYFYSMVFGTGYFWLFENKSKTTVFDAKFNFELTNMQSEGFGETPQGAAKVESQWDVVLQPGETKIKKLLMVDPTQAWGYKFGYSFKCLEQLANDTDLVRLIKQHGQVKKFQYKGEEQQMQYSVHFFNEQYVFLFENWEKKKTFKGTFNFVLENLKIEDEPQGTTSFRVELAPGGSLMKHITRVDPVKESKYKCSYSFCFIQNNANDGVENSQDNSQKQGPKDEQV